MGYSFVNLRARFNDSLRFPARQRTYDALKKAKVLGKVFGPSEQEILRKYLFETIQGKHWHEIFPFQSCLLEKVEEARVDLFMGELLKHRPTRDYGMMKVKKERQLYGLLVELDLRALLIEKSREPEASLGILPCSLLMLERLVGAFPSAKILEDLRGKTERDYKSVGIRNPAARQLAEFCAERLPAQVTMAI